MAAPAASLAKQQNLLGEELAQFATALTTPGNTDYSKSSGPPYVGFVANTSKNLTDMLAAGCRNGQPFLVVNGKYVPLVPFEYHVIEAAQLWCKFAQDTSGKVLAVTDVDPQTWGGPFKETIEAAILAYAPDGTLVPATVSFRTTKADGGRKGLDGLKAASSPDWAGRSKEHAETAKIPYPFARFFIRGETVDDVAKKSGNALKLFKASILTTTPAKAKALGEFFADPKSQRALADTIKRHRGRVAELREKIDANEGGKK